jgi:hypothetical protein
MLKPLNNRTIWTLFSAFIVAAFTFVLYFLTMPSQNVGYADSDELLTVAYFGGVAHPPGYPVYTSLLHLFLKLPLADFSLAAKGHFLSVILASITVFLVFLSAANLFDLVSRKKKILLNPDFDRLFVSSLVTLGLIQNKVFWTYGHVTEKHIFSALLAAASVFLITKLISAKDKAWPLLYVGLWLLIGFSASHHQVLILFALPALALPVLLKIKPRQDTILKSLAALLLGFTLPLLLLWTLNLREVPVSWRFEPTLQGLFDHVTRKDFAGDRYMDGKEAGAYFDRDNFNLDTSVSSIGTYLKVFLNHFGYWFVFIGLVALRFGSQLHKKSFLLFAGMFLLLGILLAGYLKLSDDWGIQAITFRQYLPGYVIASLLLVYGYILLLQRLVKAGNLIIRPTQVTILLIAIPVIVLGYRTYKLYPQLDLSEYDLVSRRYSEMIENFDAGGLVTCYSDISCFALLYEHWALGKRPDLTIVPLAYPLVQDTMNQADLQGFTYDKNPFLLFDIVTWNIGKRPVYAVEVNDYYYNLFGLEYPFMYYVPQGYYGELTRFLPDRFPDYDMTITKEWLNQDVPAFDPMRRIHKSAVGKDHILNGTLLLKMYQRQRSLQEFNQAANIFFQFGAQEKEQISALRNNLEQIQPRDKFSPGSMLDRAAFFLDFIPDLLEQGYPNRAYLAAMAAVSIEPENPLTHLQLAKLYENAGDTYFAQKEYLHTLMLDPVNEEAREGFSRVGGL